jgi:hypothetical protein
VKELNSVNPTSTAHEFFITEPLRIFLGFCHNYTLTDAMSPLFCLKHLAAPHRRHFVQAFEIILFSTRFVQKH